MAGLSISNLRCSPGENRDDEASALILWEIIDRLDGIRLNLPALTDKTDNIYTINLNEHIGVYFCSNLYHTDMNIFSQTDELNKLSMTQIVHPIQRIMLKLKPNARASPEQHALKKVHHNAGGSDPIGFLNDFAVQLHFATKLKQNISVEDVSKATGELQRTSYKQGGILDVEFGHLAPDDYPRRVYELLQRVEPFLKQKSDDDGEVKGSEFELSITPFYLLGRSAAAYGSVYLPWKEFSRKLTSQLVVHRCSECQWYTFEYPPSGECPICRQEKDFHTFTLTFLGTRYTENKKAITSREKLGNSLSPVFNDDNFITRIRVPLLDRLLVVDNNRIGMWNIRQLKMDLLVRPRRLRSNTMIRASEYYVGYNMPVELQLFRTCLSRQNRISSQEVENFLYRISKFGSARPADDNQNNYKLRTQQSKIVDFVKENWSRATGGAIMCIGTGMGKTRLSLATAEVITPPEKQLFCVIIGNINNEVHQNGKYQSGFNFEFYQRWAGAEGHVFAKVSTVDAVKSDAQFGFVVDSNIMHSEDDRRFKELLKAIGKKKKSDEQTMVLIVDEAHNFRNTKTVGFKRVFELCDTNLFSYRLILTATPVFRGAPRKKSDTNESPDLDAMIQLATGNHTIRHQGLRQFTGEDESAYVPIVWLMSKMGGYPQLRFLTHDVDISKKAFDELCREREDDVSAYLKYFDINEPSRQEFFKKAQSLISLPEELKAIKNASEFVARVGIYLLDPKSAETASKLRSVIRDNAGSDYPDFSEFADLTDAPNANYFYHKNFLAQLKPVEKDTYEAEDLFQTSRYYSPLEKQSDADFEMLIPMMVEACNILKDVLRMEATPIVFHSEYVSGCLTTFYKEFLLKYMTDRAQPPRWVPVEEDEIQREKFAEYDEADWLKKKNDASSRYVRVKSLYYFESSDAQTFRLLRSRPAADRVIVDDELAKQIREACAADSTMLSFSDGPTDETLDFARVMLQKKTEVDVTNKCVSVPVYTYLRKRTASPGVCALVTGEEIMLDGVEMNDDPSARALVLTMFRHGLIDVLCFSAVFSESVDLRSAVRLTDLLKLTEAGSDSPYETLKVHVHNNADGFGVYDISFKLRNMKDQERTTLTKPLRSFEHAIPRNVSGRYLTANMISASSTKEDSDFLVLDKDWFYRHEHLKNTSSTLMLVQNTTQPVHHLCHLHAMWNITTEDQANGRVVRSNSHPLLYVRRVNGVRHDIQPKESPFHNGIITIHNIVSRVPKAEPSKECEQIKTSDEARRKIAMKHILQSQETITTLSKNKTERNESASCSLALDTARSTKPLFAKLNEVYGMKRLRVFSKERD